MICVLTPTFWNDAVPALNVVVCNVPVFGIYDNGDVILSKNKDLVPAPAVANTG